MDKILLLVHEWPSKENLSSNRFVLNDAVFMREDYEITIVIMNNTKKNWELELFDQFIQFKKSSLRNPIQLMRNISRIKKFSNENTILISSLPETILLAFAVRNSFKRWIHFEHSVIFSRKINVQSIYNMKIINRIKISVKNYILSQLLKSASFVVVPSLFLAKAFSSLKRLKIIPNMILKEINLIEYRKSENKNAIFVGSMDNNKDPLLALKIFNVLSRKGICNEMHFYGTGPLVDELKSDIRKDSHYRNVFVHGEVKPEVYRERLRSSKVLIAPSKVETFGIVLFEAILEGIQIITSGLGGHLEFLDHYSMVFYRSSLENLDDYVDDLVNFFEAEDREIRTKYELDVSSKKNMILKLLDSK